MAADLISLDELKYSLGDSVSEATPDLDAKLHKSISAASDAIRKFTDRSFGVSIAKGVRIYDFDTSGYLDIDDAWLVEKVDFTIRTFTFPVPTEYWRSEPVEGPPYEYLVIPKWAGVYSPQMGFTYNLDRISQEHGWPGLMPQVKVEAEWGWPEVPEDVRQAAILTAATMAEKPDQMVSESIAQYSYTSQNRATAGPPPAIPSKAQDLLAPYVRFLI